MFVVGLLALNGRVRADSAHVPLNVQPGVTCLDENTLASALAQALAGAVVASDVEVEVIGSNHDPRSVALRIHYGDGSEFVRSFSPAPERCEHLHQTVALALAFALKASASSSLGAGDSGGQHDANEAGEHPDEPASLEPSPARGTSRVDPPRARARTPNQFAVSAGALFTPGFLGNVSGGAQLQVVLMKGKLGVRTGVLGLRSTEQTMPHSGHYTVGLAAARLDLCARLGRHERLSAELCVGPLAGMYQMRGAGLDPAANRRVRFLGLAAGLDVVQALGRAFAVRGSAGLIAGLQPVTVVARDRTGKIVDRQDLSRVGAALLLGIDYRFE